MTEIEFLILDELYFVTSFGELKRKIQFAEDELKECIYQMIQKSWVNYYSEMDGEANPTMDIHRNNLEKLYFLASKQGLFEHNTK